MTVPIAHVLSDWLNPAIGAIWVVAALRVPRGERKEFALASIASVVICYGIAHGIRSMRLHGLPREFPSGHEALGSSVASSFARLGRAWAIAALILTVALGVALVDAGYHVPADVAASFLGSPIITAACHRTLRRKLSNPVSSSP